MICYRCGQRHGRREPGPTDWTPGACADCGALDMLAPREAFEINRPADQKEDSTNG